LFGDLAGRSLEVTIDEEGDASAVDVTGDAAPLDEEELAGFESSGHHVELLPTQPLEVGARFPIAADWKESAKELIAELDTADMDAEAAHVMRDLVEVLLDAAKVEIVGELAGVENGWRC
jgi:hypothetical protein